jgi:hypothetical protein
MPNERKERDALRQIRDMHKTQINLKTHASRCAICKTPVPCDTQRLVLGALGGPRHEPTFDKHWEHYSNEFDWDEDGRIRQVALAAWEAASGAETTSECKCPAPHAGRCV